MKILSRLFTKSPADLLAKGDRYMKSDAFFEARSCYEDGLGCCNDDALRDVILKRVDHANYKLAELNLNEAEFSISRGDTGKAVDHLELVKTLTYDECLREKAELLLKSCTDRSAEPEVQIKSSACGSCSSKGVADCDEAVLYDDSLPPMEYYDLLIRQLPPEQYKRYSELGEDFAYAYIAASQDRNDEALRLFEFQPGIEVQDIYCCEAGKVLHRMGRDSDAELSFRKGLQANPSNSLIWLNLALLLIDAGRLDQSLDVLDRMVDGSLMPEQAMLMRAEVLEAKGDLEAAISQYALLLKTPFARSAAEKLHGVLLLANRHADAAAVFKQYLGKCCH